MPLKQSLRALFLIAFSGFWHSAVLAQDNTRLATEVSPSLSEIMNRLDKITLANARIRLKDSWDSGTYRPPWDMGESAKGTWILTQGFRLTNIDGCTLLLRNDDVKTLSKSLKVENPDKQLAAEVYVSLHRLSPTKGRSPYRYSKDPDKVRLLGAWRTEYKYKGFFSRSIVGLAFFSAGSKATAHWESNNLSFTFDSKERAQEFDAVFRQAIKLCGAK